MQDNQKQIGDRLYSFGLIPPVESVHVQAAIVKVIGAPLFQALTGAASMDKKLTEAEMKTQMQAAVVTAIGLLASGMDPDSLVALLQRVFKYVSVEVGSGTFRRVNMDEHFLGRNREMWQVLVAAITFNFKDFFPAGLFDSFVAKAKTMLGSNLSNQPT